MLKPLNGKRQGKDDYCTIVGAKVSSIAEKAINEKATWLGWRWEKVKGLLKNFPSRRNTITALESRLRRREATAQK